MNRLNNNSLESVKKDCDENNDGLKNTKLFINVLCPESVIVQNRRV